MEPPVLWVTVKLAVQSSVSRAKVPKRSSQRNVKVLARSVCGGKDNPGEERYKMGLGLSGEF